MDDDLNEIEQAHLREGREPLIPQGPEQPPSAEQYVDREPAEETLEPAGQPDVPEPEGDDVRPADLTLPERGQVTYEQMEPLENTTVAPYPDAPDIGEDYGEEDDYDEDDFDIDEEDVDEEDYVFRLPETRPSRNQLPGRSQAVSDDVRAEVYQFPSRGGSSGGDMNPVFNITVQAGAEMASQIASQVEPALMQMQQELSHHTDDSIMASQYLSSMDDWS